MSLNVVRNVFNLICENKLFQQFELRMFILQNKLFNKIIFIWIWIPIIKYTFIRLWLEILVAQRTIIMMENPQLKFDISHQPNYEQLRRLEEMTFRKIHRFPTKLKKKKSKWQRKMKFDGRIYCWNWLK